MDRARQNTSVQGRARHSWRNRLALGALALAVFGAPLAAAQEEAAHRPKKAFPHIRMNKRAQGEEAIRGLADRLHEVADWYGKSPDEFARELRRDRRAWLDHDGRLLYIDDFPVPTQAEAASAAPTAAEAPFSTDQTFALHSRPGAKRVIYLDFQGQVVTNSAWNSSYGLSAIDAKPFDLDGVPSSFSAAELERIQYIWQRVAEDYAPFDVDVTTQEPPADAITRSSSSDLYFGTRVVITQDWTAATSKPCGCGGIAYVGTYDDTTDSYKPAWVFFNQLGSGNEKYVAEAISHEAGHNLGLSHDGTSTTGYYAGHGSGATGWAPIMGVGYYKEVVQWSKGEYPGATQTQDDLLVIQNTGVPLRPDDHGDTAAAPTPLDAVANGSSASLSGGGVIGTRTDVDVFSFTAAPGTMTLNVKPAARGPNLDVSARLYDAAGNLLASSNPVDTLDASLSVTIASAGTYHLFVDGIGKGDLSTGYSDYASEGEYTITGTVPLSGGGGGGQAPVAVAASNVTSGPAPLTVNFSSAGSRDPDGGAITYLWTFGDGSTSSSANPAHTYTTPGTYTATLKVTDPSGATATNQVNNITVTPAAAPRVHVAAVTMATSTRYDGSWRGRAAVKVVDATGKAVSGATVSGTWSGIVSGTSSGSTASTGKVTLNSQWTQAKGTITFTINGVNAAGYTYDAGANTITSGSVSR